MSETEHSGLHWRRALATAKPMPLPIRRGKIPTTPGVYIWFRFGHPIYVGEALGTQGLRGRLKAHFGKGRDLSRSTLRASVAAKQLGIERSVARLRPSVMSLEQVAVVNQWLGECEVGWVEIPDAEEAHAVEIDLREEWLPPLNRV